MYAMLLRMELINTKPKQQFTNTIKISQNICFIFIVMQSEKFKQTKISTL